MVDKHQNPEDNIEFTMPFVSDERFVELTGGIQRSELHGLMVGMREFGSVGVRLQNPDGSQNIVKVSPGNMENGALLPVLTIEDANIRTTLRSFGSVQCAFTVESLDLGVSVHGGLKTKKAIEVQDEADLKLIPGTHWEALVMVKDGIAREKQELRAKKAGGLISRLRRSK